MSGIGYRAEIDGLRAVAVIPVILFHLGVSWIPGGFIGVDVFFVISGFLITSIIKKELEGGTFSFRNFWARRVRRILPAMIFVTAATLPVAYFYVFRPEQQIIGRQALAALFSVANIYFWRSAGDYWGTAAEESPFLHTWSLSVEEQFYLFFPLVMWLVFRFRSRWLKGCIAIAALGSLVLFLWGSQFNPTATFYLLPTRVWELGAGCLMAVSLGSQQSRNSEFRIFASTGLGLIFLSYVFFDSLSGGLALAVVGTALVIAFGETGLCYKMLSKRPVLHIGKLSYSLYLWHWPVLVLAEPVGVERESLTGTVVLLIAVYFLALGTYHLVERPTRRREGIVPAILVSGVLVASCAFWMASAPRYYDTTEYSEARYITFDCNPSHQGLRERNIARFATTILENPGYRPDAFCTDGIRVGDRSIGPDIVVIGDSHGCMWSDSIATVANDNGLNAAFYCWRGLNPFIKVSVFRQPGKKSAIARFNHAKLSHIEEWKPSLVIVGKSWSDNDVSESRSLIEFLGQQGSRVLLIEDPPRLPCGNINAMQWLASQDVQPLIGERRFIASKLLSSTEGGRGVVRSIAASYDHVEFLPTYDLYASESGVLALDGRDVIYLDDDHLLQTGARRVLPRLQAAVTKLTTEP